MLVLTYTNRFGVDLDQLCQGVLQAACNAGCTAQAHIDIWHFLAGKFAGGIHRSARLANHHFLNFRLVWCCELLDEIGSQFVGFTAGGAIANGDQIDTVFLTKFVQCVQ